MNYDPNATHWNPGDLVLHDADAKRADMLMRVVGYLPDGRCQTEYVEPEKRKRWGAGKRSRLLNRNEVLHDPARFGVTNAGAGSEETVGERVCTRCWERHQQGLAKCPNCGNDAKNYDASME